MNGHTPGPWNVLKKKNSLSINTASSVEEEDRIEYEEDRDTSIAGIWWDETEGLSEENIANAHLMAESPNLLLACETAEEWVKSVDDPDMAISGGLLLVVLRRAIAKAKGEA